MHGWSLEEKYPHFSFKSSRRIVSKCGTWDELGSILFVSEARFLDDAWKCTLVTDKLGTKTSPRCIKHNDVSTDNFSSKFPDMIHGKESDVTRSKLLSINQVRCIAVREAFVVRSVKCEVTRYIAKLSCSYCKLWILILLVKNTLSILAQLIISSGKSSLWIFQEYSVLKEIQHFAGWPFSQCQRQWSRTFIFHVKTI